MELAEIDAPALAKEMLEAIDNAGSLTPPSQRYEGFDLATAYKVTAALHALRSARGEKPVGRKIGFTNRTIWEQYAVYGPIWGYMYDTTLREIADVTALVDLSKFAEPLIEPEIAFGFARAPKAGMDEAAILDCIEWAAHGFEIAQSHFPGWKFAAADTVANGGLHGAYFIGPRVALGHDRARWLEQLLTFEISLFCDDKPIDRGQAKNVLDSPVSALRHLIELLANDPDNPPLQAGEIITTGTVTRAFPVSPGQHWRTEVHGLPVPGLALRF